MKFNRCSAVCLSLTIALSSSFAIAQDLGTASKRSPQDVLSAVPGDAWAVLCIPNVTRFDARLTAFGQQLQAPMMPSIGMARMMAGIMTGFDNSGGLAVAVLPVSNMGDVGGSVVALIPTTDYDAMIGQLSPEIEDDGTTTIVLQGQKLHVAPFGKFAAVSESPMALGKVVKSSATFKDKLAPERLARINADDITLWLNVGAITKSNMFNGLAAMAAAMGSDVDVFRQFDSASISLHLDPAGLTFGMHVDADPSSDMGKTLTAAKASSESLLTGLPNDNFLFAMGQITTKEAGQLGANMMDGMLAKASAGAGKHQKLVEGLRQVAHDIVARLRHLSLSVSALEPGSDGMIGVVAVITTDGDSKRLRDAVGTTIASVKEAFASDPDAGEYVSLVNYNAEAENVAGVSVAHLKVTLPEKAKGKGPLLTTIVGKDQLLVRLATVDDKHLAITFGGGEARLKQVIESVRSGSTALATSEGIREVAAYLPKKRNSEAYLAVDRVLKLASAVATAIGGPDPIPVAVPDINVPIAIAGAPSGQSGTQSELFLPIKVIFAIKEVAVPMMMGRPQQQVQPIGEATPPT